MRNQIILGLTTILLLGVIADMVSAEINYGSNYETDCQNNICTTTLYSYEKYFLKGDVWEKIDENWYDCSSEGKIQFCTKNYYFNVTAEGSGLISAFSNNRNYSVKMKGFMNWPLNFNPYVEGSVITYSNVIQDYVDVRYQYLPTKLKEEIIIKKPLPNIENDFNISFTKMGDANFDIPVSIICDTNFICELIENKITEDQLYIQVPSSFLNNPNITYPLTIDPTIQLNDSFIAWNGIVQDKGQLAFPRFIRISNPSILSLGGQYLSRGDIDWNLTSVQDDSAILNATLNLFIINTTSINYLNIRGMNGSSNNYSNNDAGNQQFYNDMGEGDIYASNNSISNTTVQPFINLTFNKDGITAIENSLSSNSLSMGLDSNLSNFMNICGRDYSNASMRPKLIITGIGTSNSDMAIEEGINNSLPNNPISSAQQVYIVNAQGNHYLGTFDKATIFGNQTWAFNYVNFGESFTNIPSLFEVLNVWENMSLSYGEIVNQVEMFINGTIY